MAIAARFGLCSLLAFALIGACSTSHVSDDESCTPDSERECMCGDEPGVEICNTQGSGYGACECTTTGTGGSGGGGGSSGSDADGSAGTAGSGGSAGSDSDAATPETDGGETDGGETADATTTGRDALVPPTTPPTDAGGTACEGGGECFDCIAQNCCDELNACVEPDSCAALGSGGFSEAECVDLCLMDIVETGGTAGTAELDDCASSCAEMGNSVSAVTRSLFECMVGECNAGCY